MKRSIKKIEKLLGIEVPPIQWVKQQSPNPSFAAYAGRFKLWVEQSGINYRWIIHVHHRGLPFDRLISKGYHNTFAGAKRDARKSLIKNWGT